MKSEWERESAEELGAYVCNVPRYNIDRVIGLVAMSLLGQLRIFPSEWDIEWDDGKKIGRKVPERRRREELSMKSVSKKNEYLGRRDSVGRVHTVHRSSNNERECTVIILYCYVMGSFLFHFFFLLFPPSFNFFPFLFLLSSSSLSLSLA